MSEQALTFGARAREARQRRGLTQRALAAATFTSQSNLSRIDTGQRVATIPELIKIAGALGTTLGDLTGDSEVRSRIKYAVHNDGDVSAGETKERVAFLLEMDAFLDERGFASRC